MAVTLDVERSITERDSDFIAPIEGSRQRRDKAIIEGAEGNLITTEYGRLRELLIHNIRRAVTIDGDPLGYLRRAMEPFGTRGANIEPRRNAPIEPPNRDRGVLRGSETGREGDPLPVLQGERHDPRHHKLKAL